jgi:hypothetical protein
VLALGGIVLSMPIYLLTNIQADEIVRTTYQAKCHSSGEYVVLQGSQIGEIYQFDEFVLNDTIYNDTKSTLNFYCRYYEEIQPHVIAYTQAKTPAETLKVNSDFFAFKESKPEVYSYPPLYTLETVSEVTQYNQIYNPIIEWLLTALSLFIVLQFIRMCYVYVTFGKVVWHPFKRINYE